MAKSQSYYDDEDEDFQLDLNLQNTRRDLIDELEEYEDCFACNRLECCCSRKSSLRSTTVSEASTDSTYLGESDRSSEIYYNAAPPAYTLPTPRWCEKKKSNESANHEATTSRKQESAEKKWQRTLKNWIRASIPNVTQSTSTVIFPVPTKVLDQVNYSWPPFPKSIWSDEMLKETIARERILCCEAEEDGNSSVEAFFNYFKTGKIHQYNTISPPSHPDGKC